MTINQSLSRGLSRRSFQQVLDESALFFTAVERYAPVIGCPTTAKGARKYQAKLRNVVQAFSPLVRSAENDTYGPYLAWLMFEPANADGDIALFKWVDAPLARYRDSIRMVRFSRHAVARGHQRLDVLAWEDMAAGFVSAITTAWLFARVRTLLPIKQAFLPSTDGIFVGGFDDDNCLYMETFIKWDGAARRWQAAQELLVEYVERFPSADSKVIDAVMLFRPAQLQQEIDWFSARLAAPEWQWLQEKYEPRPDPVGEAWKHYRQEETDETRR